MHRWLMCFSMVLLLLSVQQVWGRSAVVPGEIVPTSCQRMADDSGRGQWPYNSRLIDGCLLAGGTPFHPKPPANTASHVLEIFERIYDLGIRSVVILNVPVDDREVRLEEKIAATIGLKTFRLPMNSEKVPTASETEKLLELIKNKAYVHCQWGADRTGAIVAKYLRVCHGYSGREAWEAVTKKGSHTGRYGALKLDPKYSNLVLYFWPEVIHEDLEVCLKYGIPFSKP